MSSTYCMYPGYLPPQGIPIPRRSLRQKESPFVPSIHPPYPSKSLHAPYVQTPRTMSTGTPWSPSLQLSPFTPGHQQMVARVTPWMQPAALPNVLDPQTRVWPPGEVVPVPCATPLFEEIYEPGTFPAVEWGAQVPLRIHPSLIYNPAGPELPFLEWDISHRPDMAKRLTGRHVCVSVDLAEKATAPTMPSMWIKSDHPVLASWMNDWGPIVVNTPNFTVRDVLDAIWIYMQMPLTERDMERIVASGQRFELEKSARRRAKAGHDLLPVALRVGFRRVDVLGTQRRFLGLRAVIRADHTWTTFMGLTTLPGNS